MEDENLFISYKKDPRWDFILNDEYMNNTLYHSLIFYDTCFIYLYSNLYFFEPFESGRYHDISSLNTSMHTS